MQRKLSEKLVLIVPGVLLALALTFGLIQLSASGSDDVRPTFQIFIDAPESDVVAQAETSTQDAEQSSARNDGRIATLPHNSAFVADAFAIAPREVDFEIVVVDDSGEYVPNAKIEIVERSRLLIDGSRSSTRVDRELSRRSVMANAEGTYKFTDTVDSRFEVSVSVNGYAKKRYRLRRPGKKFIHLVKNATVVGKVYGPNQEPLEGIEVTLWDSSAKRKQTAITDVEGIYEFRSVSPKCATLRVVDPRYRPEVAHLIAMDSGAAYRSDFYLKLGRELSLNVFDVFGQRAAGAEVKLIDLSTRSVVATTKTLSDGVAEFRCLEPETSYFLVANHKAAVARVEIPWTGNDDNIELNLNLRQARSFFGVVRDRDPLDGVPLEGVQVIFEAEATAENKLRHRVKVTSGPNGLFEVPGLDPDLTYTVFLYHQAYALGVNLDKIKPEPIDASTDLSAAPNEEPKPFVLQTPARFDGVVTDGKGQAIPRASIVLKNVDSEMSELTLGSTLTVYPDDNGRYSFTNLPAGHYELSVSDYRTGDRVVSEIHVDNGVVVATELGSDPLEGPLQTSLGR